MKNILMLVGIIVIIGGGFILLSPKKDAMVNEIQMMKKEDTMMKNEPTTSSTTKVMKDNVMMARTGSYEVYSPEKLAKANSGKVVLFFRASWCPTCKALDADIVSNLKSIPENVTILDVDYDNSTDLKKKYGVTYQHTLVEVNADGLMIKKWAGSPTLASLVKEIK